MVALIEHRGITDPKLLEAFLHVPRHLFVPESLHDKAYGDYPLPIGYGQTISQPYIVALMTQTLALKPGDRVLEIGTGSGYQAAILAEMRVIVYTVEIVPELYASARALFSSLDYENVHFHLGDGHKGWHEYKPYDKIIVTAAPPTVPSTLVEQLADGGHMVIPVGPKGYHQVLLRLTKTGEQINRQELGGVAFVPLVKETH